MANAPSKTILVAGIGVALGAMLMLNVLAQRIDPKYQEKLERERMAAEAQKQAEAQQNKPPTMPQAPAPGAGLVELGEEKVLGKADAAKEIVVGYEWSPAVQADPSKVYAAVETIQKAAPDARIRVVNVDANPEVKPGVSVGGKVVVIPQPDGSLSADEHAIQDALGMHDHGGGSIPSMGGPSSPAGGPGITPATPIPGTSAP
jgi:hypothetical protein